MRSIIVILFFSGFNLLGQNALQELDSAEYFDFWVGTWELSWEGGQGTNRIEKTLDGNVIQEHFEITEGRNAGFKGTSISVFQPRFNRWKQAWADSGGGYFDFTGRFEQDKRIFQTEPIPLKDGRQMIQRMVFHDIQEDNFTWDWEMSVDAGETWKLNWRINYQRLK